MTRTSISYSKGVTHHETGIPKELKEPGGRVAITPDDARRLIAANHSVVVQENAGRLAGFDDLDYIEVGATIGTQDQVWASDMVIKVKEPLPEEFKFFRPDLKIFGYMHLAPNPTLIDALIKGGVEAIALENIELNGRLPGLDPMSKIAGRIAGQLATTTLYHANGGNRILLGGTDGTPTGKAVVVGGGFAFVVGSPENLPAS